MPFKEGNIPWNKGKTTPRNKEKGRESQRRYIKRNRKKEKERSRQHYKDNPEYMRKYQIKRLYGLSYESWLEIWDKQNGKCVICEKPFVKPSEAYVDHIHKTGEIRGLLCVKCNFGIGYFDDDPGLLIKASKYLKKY